MNNHRRFLTLLLLCLFGCTTTSETPFDATAFAQQHLIADGHIDVPYRLHKQWDDVSQATSTGDFDYPRAKAGGLNAPFMSIYIPARLDGTPQATQLAHQLIDSVEAIVARAPDKFAIATSPDDLVSHQQRGLISLPMGMENGSPIQKDIGLLDVFYERGIRYITLAHSRANQISDSSYDIKRPWKGLSPFGEKVVARMNDLGIMIDVSHISDDAFRDVIALSRAPVIASHSSLRQFTPGWERNMDISMLQGLKQNDGIIMINFGSGFVSPMARGWWDNLSTLRKQWQAQYANEPSKIKQLEADYRIQHPYPFATLEKVLDHIDMVKRTIGVRHIGIGSDYDGVGNTLPTDLKDVASYPNLIQGLHDRGYTDSEISDILGGNLLRVWRAVEKTARQS